MSESKEIADRAFDAGMLLAFPPHTQDASALNDGSLVGRHPDVADRSRPFDVAQQDRFARLDRTRRRSFRPGPRLLGACPPAAGAPVGFSKEIERDSNP